MCDPDRFDRDRSRTDITHFILDATSMRTMEERVLRVYRVRRPGRLYAMLVEQRVGDSDIE